MILTLMNMNIKNPVQSKCNTHPFFLFGMLVKYVRFANATTVS